MRSWILFIILGMGVVTYLPRWLPLLILSRRPLPSWLVEWLDFIPAAILSALILPAILTAGEPRHIEPLQPVFWVTIPTLIFAIKTRSLAGTVVTGMALYWLATKMPF
jgi:branched-subunit amino acid transport protein